MEWLVAYFCVGLAIGILVERHKPASDARRKAVLIALVAATWLIGLAATLALSVKYLICGRVGEGEC